MKEVTQAQVDRLKGHLSRRFFCTVIDKSAAIEMQYVSMAFDILSRIPGVDALPDGKTFLERYSTTIGPMVYLASNLSPRDQLIVLAHEVQHVHQFWNGGLGLPGGPGLWWLYLVEREARVRYEADAYATSLEVEYALTGALPSLDELAFPLEGGYALTEKELKLGRDLLNVSATSLANGLKGVTPVGLEVVEWLRREGLLAG
jgi:hypothetical protein